MSRQTAPNRFVTALGQARNRVLLKDAEDLLVQAMYLVALHPNDPAVEANYDKQHQLVQRLRTLSPEFAT